MKCINCYREIEDNLKFCNFCGAKQPVDREAYEREHPELTEALSEEEVMEKERQMQIEETERLRQEAELKEQEEAERKAQEAEEQARAEAERKAREQALDQINVSQKEPDYQEEQTKSLSGVSKDNNYNYRPQIQQGSVYQPPVYNNIIACPECGHLVSPRAYSCPQCGCPIRGENYVQPQQNPVTKENDNKKGNTGVLWLLLTIIIALLIAVLSSKGCRNQANDYETVSDSTIIEDTTVVDSTATELDLMEEPVETTHSSSSHYICYSEDLYSDGYDEGQDLGNMSVLIDNSWLEHIENEGIKIHVNMTAKNMLGCTLEVKCLFWFEEGREIKSTDGQYETYDRQVCTKTNVTSNYEECNWSDLTLWIPYSQFKAKRDYKQLKCRVEVFYDGCCLATSEYMHFGCERK